MRTKKRYQEKDEKGVRIGFNTYIKFYEYAQGSAKYKTFNDFAKSSYYKAFVKFGRHCLAINAVSINKFANYVIKNNKKLDHWTRDSIYNEYLLYLLNAENPNDALARALEYGIKWGEDKNANHGDVLRYGNVNEICYAITTGRISAWVVYNCNSGRKLLDTLSEEQKLIIWNYIDPDVWNKKFTDYKSDQLYVQQMLLEAGW